MHALRLAAIALCFGATACENDLASVRDAFPPEVVFVEEIRDFEMLYSDSALVRVKVTGPALSRHLDEKNPRQEFPQGVNVAFYDGNLQVNSEISSRYAVRLENENRIILRDSVVWRGIKGEYLETEELIWDEITRKVYTNKFVVMRRNEEIIWGHGFESDDEFTRSRVKAIEGRIKVN